MHYTIYCQIDEIFVGKLLKQNKNQWMNLKAELSKKYISIHVHITDIITNHWYLLFACAVYFMIITDIYQLI